ncbi:MAG TPA: A24 family peptidase [Smithella sp.]|nr:A24 family peptidase [Smithella sp.]
MRKPAVLTVAASDRSGRVMRNDNARAVARAGDYFVELRESDVITLPGIPLFFLAAVFICRIHWLEALLGLLIGGGVLFTIAVLYELIAKREGMGGGDIKLLAMIGAFFGWKSLLFVLLCSSLLGAIVGLTTILIKKQNMRYAVPFGPFLSAAAIAYIFWGDGVTKIFLMSY